MDWRVVCLVGPSGVGKSSYAKRLAEKHNFTQPTVVTSRQRRSDDDGRYLYVDELVFSLMVSTRSFLEWDGYSGYYYGTLLCSVEEIMSQGYYSGIILDLTPKGCKKVIEVIPDAVIIAILPDNPAWLLKRLKNRNSQTPEEIQKRTEILEAYLIEISSLSCRKVYASYEPNSWDETFRAIEEIVFAHKTFQG